MNFNNHWELEGRHSFLSPSSYHWVNYSEEKLEERYLNYLATERGTRLHALAKELIDLGVKLPRSNKTLNLYVNDAIGYKMNTEQPLFYSYNCFGTADAISFRKNLLRIHDLKTGQTPASMTQLEVYSAIFCLEYDVNPIDISMELRIYQNDTVLVHEPEPVDISFIMDRIVSFDHIIEHIKDE
jgi:hypothetical protein